MFKKITEAQISRAIVGEFSRWFMDYIVSDVVIVGGGPSGLIAGKELAKDGFKVLIVESNNYIGGGILDWRILDESLDFSRSFPRDLKRAQNTL
jgi:ribulose 1,5-bisphosphate synthetase/thiazole synthase